MNWLRSFRTRPVPVAEPSIPPPAVLRIFRCAEPGCSFADRDPAVTLAHMFSIHVTRTRQLDA